MPNLPSTIQSEASRRNGALSRGPVSEAGKATSAQNAVRHGLRGSGVAVRAEESGWYAGLLATHRVLYAPANEAETGLVEQLCIVELKLYRLDLLELAALDEPADGETDRKKLASLGTLARYRTRILKERWEVEHRLGQLKERRMVAQADAATVREELREAARARAYAGLALRGVAGSGLLSGEELGGTDEPEPAPEQSAALDAGAADVDPAVGTDEPEPATGLALNRRNRRRMERLARRNAKGQQARAA